MNSGLASGAFTPVVDRTFDLTDIAEAHRYTAAGDQVGEIVVTVDHGRSEQPESTPSRGLRPKGLLGLRSRC
ncbi:zinc-binding dehydrogenase [Streptomyces sp. bgisy034]|uniref:zinc-binding dehydrogenase n=1 Tax=Streptomyces sp. bgisy034 TaxID=3413774 RepID=UPI003EB9111B